MIISTDFHTQASTQEISFWAKYIDVIKCYNVSNLDLEKRMYNFYMER